MTLFQFDVNTAFLNGNLSEQYIHGTGRRIHSAWQRESGVQIEMVIVWIEAEST